MTLLVKVNHTRGVKKPKPPAPPTLPNAAIEEAYSKAGGRRKVQESLKVSKQTLCDWKRWGYVPKDRCGDLERLSGVSRRKLNPHFDWGPVRIKATDLPTEQQEVS